MLGYFFYLNKVMALIKKENKCNGKQDGELLEPCTCTHHIPCSWVFSRAAYLANFANEQQFVNI